MGNLASTIFSRIKPFCAGIVICLVFSVFLTSCSPNNKTNKNTGKKYDTSTIYEVKGSDLAANYANPNYYADKVFNITLRVDHVTMGGNVADVQYHGGFQKNHYGQIIGGARVDVFLTIEQAKKYNLQQGKIVKFENMVWTGNEQLEIGDSGRTFETMGFAPL